jgi:O-antigen/teichoic acid export membrane protein
MDEKFVRKFLKGSFATALGTMSTIAFHFLSIAVMSRYVDKTLLGLYFLIIAIATAGKILAGLGLDLTLVQLLASEEEDAQKEAFAAVIWTRIFTMIILGLLVFFGGTFLLSLFDAQLAAYQWHLLILFGLMSFRELFFYIFQGLHQFRNYAFVQTASAILKFVLVLIFRDSLDLTTLLYIEFAMLASSLILQLFLLPLKRLSPARFLFSRAVLPKLFHYALPLYSNSLLTYVSDYGAIFIVGFFLSPASIAAYEIAKKIPDGFSRLFTAFHVVYFPNLSALFAARELKNAEKLLNKCLTILSIGSFALVLVALLFRYELVLLVFSERYLEVQWAFVLIMLAVCLHLFANTMGYSLVSAGLPSDSTRVNMVAMGLEFLLSLLFVPFLGYIGVAVSYLIMTIVSQIICYFYLRHHGGIHINLNSFLKPAAYFLGLSGIYWFVGSESWLWRAALLLVYAGLCFAFIPDARQAVPYLWKFFQDTTLQRGRKAEEGLT